MIAAILTKVGIIGEIEERSWIARRSVLNAKYKEICEEFGEFCSAMLLS
jgi:hypothetical protein